METAFHLVTRDPSIVCSVWDFAPGQPTLRALLDRLGPRRAHVLLLFWWAMESPEAAAAVARALDQLRRWYPHCFYLLANTRSQQRRFAEAGVHSIFCNHNALLDESLFPLGDAEDKRYDAIYNAQLGAFKRHELAVSVENLALLTYFDGVNDDRTYYEQAVETLAGAHWLNPPWEFGVSRYIDAAEVALCLQRARVGLCLSAVEGAMYASVEYLLSGLPVVSTPSIGGRDVFFDPAHVAIVEADPEAVAEGVRGLIARRLDPAAIRAAVLAKMREHRRRFMAVLEEICASEGERGDIEARWSTLFVNKMLRWQPIDAVGRVRPQGD